MKFQSKDAAGGRAQAAFRRLAVDQEPCTLRQLVREFRAVAAALFADDEEQSDTRLAIAPQPPGSRDLCGKNAFRVARPASVKAIAVDSARKNGGTQSKWVENTTSGVRAAPAV